MQYLQYFVGTRLQISNHCGQLAKEEGGQKANISAKSETNLILTLFLLSYAVNHHNPWDLSYDLFGCRDPLVPTNRCCAYLWDFLVGNVKLK